MENLKKYVKVFNLVQYLSLIGIIITIYLTWVHYTLVQVACPETNVINCAKVLSSAYSTVYHVPLTLFGLFYFLVFFIVSFFKKYEIFLFIFSIIGVLSVFALVYIEIGIIKSICIYCSSIHLLVLLIFFILMYKIFFSKDKLY
jgi:uncharacterized membrane protein